MTVGGKVNYTIVGLFVVGLTTLLIVSALWLGNFFSNQKVYHKYVTYLDESVSGLSINSPVKFNGVEVGTIEDITIDMKAPNWVKLTLKVDQDTPVTQDTYAILERQGLTGVGYMELDPRGKNNQLLLPSASDPIPIIQSRTSFFQTLESKTGTLLKNLTNVSNKLNAVLDNENRRNLKESLIKLNQTLTSANTLAYNTAIASKQFPETIHHIKQTADAIHTASEQVDNTMRSGRLALNNISTQIIPPAVDVLDRVRNVMANWGALSAELKQNPAILIRGKTTSTLGPGEKEPVSHADGHYAKK
jgi:phospholipid/cholesterol/gamma-HCH transport system substrate-binding protein